MNYKIKIGISSNKKYEEKTLPVILLSLIENNISRSDIVIFIGGYDKCYQKIVDDVEYRYLDYNSFDLTSAIDIVENSLISDYWFLLHDTCKVGPRFKDSIYNFPNCKFEKIALKQKPSMNIGLYSYEYLMSMKDKIIPLKNKDYSEDGIDKCKTWHVNNEDYLLWLNGNVPLVYGNENPVMTIENINWYNTNTARITEYYKSIDLYKSKVICY